MQLYNTQCILCHRVYNSYQRSHTPYFYVLSKLCFFEFDFVSTSDLGLETTIRGELMLNFWKFGLKIKLLSSTLLITPPKTQWDVAVNAINLKRLAFYVVINSWIWVSGLPLSYLFSSDYALRFTGKTTNGFVIKHGMRSLTAVTLCVWIKSRDNRNGAALSYAVPGSDNELLVEIQRGEVFFWVASSYG